MDRQYHCLYCGHVWMAREERRYPQCPRCNRRRGVISEETYRRLVKTVKSLLKRKSPETSPTQFIIDTGDILFRIFPNLLLPPKALAQIIRDAQKEIEMEEEAEKVIKRR